MNQSAVHKASKAYSSYLDSNLKQQKPKFKKKHDESSVYLPNQNYITVNSEQKWVEISVFDRYLKLGMPREERNNLHNMKRIFFKDKPPKDFSSGTIIGITIKKSKEKYFLSFTYSGVIEIDKITLKDVEKLIKNKSDRLSGFDVGIKDKIIGCDGQKISGINRTKKYEKLEKEINKLKRKISKRVETQKKKVIKKRRDITKYNSVTKKDLAKVKKSRKDDKYQQKTFDLLALVEEGKITVLEKDYSFSKKEWKKIYNHDEIKILQKEINTHERKLTNWRKNENHHISKAIANSLDFIGLETLSIKWLQSIFGRQVKNLSLGELIGQIKYKAENQGKVVVQINRFEPSSKKCSCCGNIKKDLKLSDRIYTCDVCGLNIDRDIQAAINILIAALDLFLHEEYSRLSETEVYRADSSVRDLKTFLVNCVRIVEKSKIVDLNSVCLS